MGNKENQKVIVKAGDVFAGRNPMALGRAINAIQWFWSSDGESKYSHAGIIIDDFGTTLEALWTVKSRNIFEAYKNEQVIIARPLCDNFLKEKAIERIKYEHFGQWYPFWRLPMHMFPPIAKIEAFGKLVCSELTAKYLWYTTCWGKQYKGVNPDTLADRWRDGDNFEVIFEGILLT
jgi:hypothetical protein